LSLSALQLFPIVRIDQDNFEDFTYENSLNNGTKAVLFTGATLYGLLIPVCLYLMWHERAKGFWSVRMMIFLLLGIFTLMRCIYFFLIAFGIFATSTDDLGLLVGEIILSGLPTYFFFSISILLVMYWIEVIYFMSSPNARIHKLRPWYIGINVALYVFFLAFLVTFSIVAGESDDDDENSVASACAASDADGISPAEIVAVVYNSLLGALAFMLAMVLAFYGCTLSRRLTNSVSSNRMVVPRAVYISYMLVITFCLLSLLAQIALLLYRSATNDLIDTQTAAIIILSIEFPSTICLLVAFGRRSKLSRGLARVFNKSKKQLISSSSSFARKRSRSHDYIAAQTLDIGEDQKQRLIQVDPIDESNEEGY